MDTLPKDQSNDLTSFAGSYPDDKKTSEPPVVGAQSSPPKPTTTVPSTSGLLPQDSPKPTPTAPFGAPGIAPASAPVTQPQSFVAPVSPPVTQAAPPPVGAPPANPFQAQKPPAGPKSSGGIKRVMMLVLLLVVLLAIGFGAFQLVGRFLTKSQPKVITYWGLWENEQILTSVIEEYQSTHPNIQIAYTAQSPRQYRERLQAAISRGEGPDAFRFHNTWVPMLQEELAPAGATGYTAADFQQTFYPVASQDLIVGGQVMGVPLMFEGLALYYNEDLLRSAGVTPPTTWEEFTNAAQTLTVKDGAGQIVTAGAALGTTNNVEHFSDILATMMLQNGVNLANPQGSEAEQALAFYRIFAEEPNNVWDATLDNSILAFASGKVAFVFAPSWQVFTIREINPQLKFQIIPIPQLPGTNVTWASYWAEGVSSKSQYTDEAWEFITFLSAKEQMIKLYTEQSKVRPFGEPYARVDLAQTVANEPFVGAYVRQAPTAQSFYLASRTFDNGINDGMIKYLEDAVNSQAQSVSAQEGLETMAQGFAQVLSRYGISASGR